MSDSTSKKPSFLDKAKELFNKAKDFFAQNKKLSVILLSVFAAVLLLIAGFIVYNTFFSSGERYDEFKNPNAQSAETIFAESDADSNIVLENPIYFEEIQKQSPDVYAWIQIEGMEKIDYPIVQNSPTSGDSIDYYLTRNVNGETQRAGSIYTQWLNDKDFSDPNTVIYGHNMLNRSMFGQLKNFRDKEFFDEHRNIYIYLPEKIMQYEIISAFVYDDRHILKSFNFDSQVQTQEFFDICTNPTSMTKQVLEGATLTAQDKIITLSTCTSNDNERYLVIGKLVRTVDVVPATKSE